MLSLLGIAVSTSWIIVVGVNYAAIFLFPTPPDPWSRAPIPPDLSPAYLPLLLAILILGIIRRLSKRGSQREGAPDED